MASFMVRDSKHQDENGPELNASRPDWTAFISSMK
ncbi:DUF397 domain-containing protein [Streptomyces sp. NPDC048332]